jgi:thiol:disulfide interchange protein DsbD
MLARGNGIAAGRWRPAIMALAVFLAIVAAGFGLGIQAVEAARPSAAVVGISSVTLETPLRADTRTVMEVTAQILPGWHINSNHPTASYYIPTRLGVSTPEHVTAGAVEYPPAHAEALEFARGRKLSVFTGTAVFRVPIVAAADLSASGSLPATITINYQACDNRQCLSPASVSRTVDLRTLGLAQAQGATSATDARALAMPGANLEQTFARHGYLLGFLIVLLGGLALNLTPCVYPLIGVTIAYFGNQGGGTRRVLILALLYVLGIATMFSAVGVAAALSGGLFGAALQNPYLLASIAAVLLVLAASSFGLFTLRPPQWIVRRAGAARPGYAGSFLMGLGMGVVAAPCIGPIVLGLLLTVQRSGSPLFGFALFFTLAVGLGLPYIGLAMAAGSIRRLPRSGEWLAWIEQLFGFALAGLALYFLDPVVPGHLMLRVLPYYAAAAGVYLGFITGAGRRWRPFLVIRSALGVVAVAALVYLLIPRAGAPHLSFEPYSEQVLAMAARQHRPVLLDFSADWCIPCHEMERTTFRDPPVIAAAARFVRVRADLTAQDARNQKIIARFNIMGVPTVVLIDSRGNIRKQTVGYVGPEQMLADLRAID